MNNGELLLVSVVLLIVLAILYRLFLFWYIWLLTLSYIFLLGVMSIVMFGVVILILFFYQELHYRQASNRLNLVERQAKIEIDYEVARANSEMIRAESIAKQYQITEISAKRGALLVANGVPTYIPPIQQPSMAALPEPSQATEFLTDCNRLFDVFKQSRTVHALIIGARDSGKSTLVNRLLNVEFVTYDTIIIDVLFNVIDSGWLTHDKIKINRDFIATLTAYHASHKKEVDKVNVSRNGAAKRLLVIDEFPTILARLKADNKKQYDDVMAMLRDLYSQGSHTNHNLMLLSQTVLTQDIELSSNDKGNFIQCAIGSLATDYLALRRGKSGKKQLYERLETIAESTKYYVCFEDTNGTLDVQPLADLSDFGAKRLYGMAANEVVEVESKAMVEESIEPEPTIVKSIFDFEVIPESDMAIIQAANELKAANEFSLAKLHKKLTGKQIGGNQANTYKAILSKYGLLETVQK